MKPQVQANPQMIVRQIGIGNDGQALYAYTDSSPIPVQAQQVVRPWGAYVVAGIVASVFLCLIITLITFFVMGLAILATALSVALATAVVALVIAKSVWSDYVTERAALRKK